MARLPAVSGRVAVKKFQKLGYRIARQRGSHIRLFHPDSISHQPLTVPDHKELGRGLLRKLLRDAEITPDEFTAL